jgi:hypothetical protein
MAVARPPLVRHNQLAQRFAGNRGPILGQSRSIPELAGGTHRIWHRLAQTCLVAVAVVSRQ